MEGGRVGEMGSHDELMALGGVYRRLHDLQFLEDAPAAAPDPDDASAEDVETPWIRTAPASSS